MNYMGYADYIENQIVTHGQIDKPARYHECERLAIDTLFAPYPLDLAILDVGCGSGLGMAYLREIGYEDVSGIDLHPAKAELAGAYSGDIALFDFERTFDIIYSSHSFEHMYAPGAALEHMKSLATHFIFILPYVDTGDPKAHLASFDIGTRVDDGGETVVRWFVDHGLMLVDRQFSSLREPEIWLRFVLE